jgi:peptide subunit release factor 1 (eRF1)
MKARMETIDRANLMKYQQQLDMLDGFVGKGTSVVTLMIPGTTTQLQHMRQKVTTELSSSSNVKDTVNRRSI